MHTSRAGPSRGRVAHQHDVAASRAGDRARSEQRRGSGRARRQATEGHARRLGTRPIATRGRRQGRAAVSRLAAAHRARPTAPAAPQEVLRPMATTQSDTEDDAAGRRRHRRRSPWPSSRGPSSLLVLLIVVVLLVVKVTAGHDHGARPPRCAGAGRRRAGQATTVPAAVFDTVGAPHPAAPAPPSCRDSPRSSCGAAPTSSSSVPSSAPTARRSAGPSSIALGRFGTFAHLGATSSSADEVFPGTPTFSFDGTTYRSRYVVLVGRRGVRPTPRRPPPRPASPACTSPPRCSGA